MKNSSYQFLSTLYNKVSSTEDFVELRFIKSEDNKQVFIKLAKLSSVQNYIKKYNGQYNCYFGVALRKNSGSGKKDNCGILTALFVDIDYGNIGHKKESLFAKREDVEHLLEIYPLKPSILVHTGHGFQLYWLLENPIVLNKDNIPEIEAILKRLSISLGADSTYNIDRIFRIPGTTNIKAEEPVECDIVDMNMNLYYNFEELKNHPLLALELEKLDSDSLRRIFGILPDEDIDHSQYDQKIITDLINTKFTHEKIKQIFQFYPTTGKYLERRVKDPKGAEKYLEHSINNGFNFYQTNLTNESINFVELQDGYYVITSGANIGYYRKSRGSKKKRLSNFFVNIEEQVFDYTNNSCSISGAIVVEEKNYSYSNIPIGVLTSPKDFKNFILNTAGVAASIKYPNEVITAVQLHNQKAPEFELIDFGYNKDLTEYNTPDLTITADAIIRRNNKIRVTTIDMLDKIGFNYQDNLEVRELISVFENFIKLNKPQVIIPALSYLSMPYVFPYVNDGKRFFYFFIGPSGCGKTTLLKAINLIAYKGFLINSATSSAASMSLKGYDLKDYYFLIDDVKEQNFQNIKHKDSFMSLIQNYADGTARSRATADMSLREDKPIRGIIAFSGEDTVITEASSIARGIFIPMDKIDQDIENINNTMQTLQQLNQILPYLIQFIMKCGQSGDIQSLFSQIKADLLKLKDPVNYESANRFRLIDNIALMSTSFLIMCEFFKEYGADYLVSELSIHYSQTISDLFEFNFAKIQEKRPEEKFIETIFDLALLDKENVYNIDDMVSTLTKRNIICISINHKTKKYQILITSSAYGIVNERLRSSNDQLGHEYTTILNTLVQQGKAFVNKSRRHRFGLNEVHKQISGFIWLEELDPNIKEGLGIPLDYELVRSAEEQNAYMKAENKSQHENRPDLKDNDDKFESLTAWKKTTDFASYNKADKATCQIEENQDLIVTQEDVDEFMAMAEVQEQNNKGGEFDDDNLPF